MVLVRGCVFRLSWPATMSECTEIPDIVGQADPCATQPAPAPSHICRKAGLDHLLLGEKGELGAREAELTTQDLDVVLAHERRTA